MPRDESAGGLVPREPDAGGLVPREPDPGERVPPAGELGRSGPGAGEFADWVRPSLLAMTRLARRLAPNAEPDDVVQDALVRAWQKRDTFDADLGTPTTWLLAIVADKARAARTSRVRRLQLVDDNNELPDVSSADVQADIDLERAIDGLAERQALAVQLHYFVGLSVAETAQVMDCSAGTVKSTLFDARSKLRLVLGDDHV